MTTLGSFDDKAKPGIGRLRVRDMLPHAGRLSQPLPYLFQGFGHSTRLQRLAHRDERRILTIMSRSPFILLMFALAVWAPVVVPDQTDDRLRSLFERLRETTDANEGQLITRQIWVIWRETDDDVANSLMDRGLRDMTLERYDEALATLNKVVEATPNYAEGWNARATLLYLMGDYGSSVADVRRTLALEPRHFGAWAGLGLIYMNLDNDEAALEAFKKALTLNPHLTGSKRNIEIIKKRREDKII